jgi:peptidoglycan hydrolase-like protein with peptidoglycan-binding domain
MVNAPDVAAAPGDLSVREAQGYLKELGFYDGDIDGVMSWRTVEALVKFDASGEGPKTVIADAGRLDAVWLARLKTAAAAKAVPAAQ